MSSQKNLSTKFSINFTISQLKQKDKMTKMNCFSRYDYMNSQVANNLRFVLDNLYKLPYTSRFNVKHPIW